MLFTDGGRQPNDRRRWLKSSFILPSVFVEKSFLGKVIWEREEHPAVGEQECKDYFSKELDVLKWMSLLGSYSVQI